MKTMIALLLFLAVPAWGQGLQRVPVCGQGSPPPGASPGYQDTNGNGCVTAAPGAAAPQTYATGITTPASVTTTAAALYTYGTPAKVLVIANNGTSNVYLGWHGTAGGACTAPTSGAYDFLLQPGQFYTWGLSQPLPTCAVNALAASGTDAVSVGGF